MNESILLRKETTMNYKRLFSRLGLFLLGLGTAASNHGCAALPGEKPVYRIERARQEPDLTDWESPTWRNSEIGRMNNVYVATLFCPAVEFRALYDAGGIYVIFRIEDQYVFAKEDNRSNRISFDSCVEFFLQPPDSDGYFCFELAASGNALLYHCCDINAGKLTNFSAEEYGQVTIRSAFSGKIDPAIDEKTTWTIGAFVPFSLLEKYYGGEIDPAALYRQTWRGNFYKCAVFANPHWMSWAPLPKIDFHLPEYFGTVTFGR